AAYLARAGEDVSLIARGERAKHLAANGVTITGLEDFTVPVEIITDPASLNSADVLILAVKTYDSADAIASVRHMEVGSVFSIQNGVMKNQQLVAAFGAAHVLGCISMIGGSIEPNGAASFVMNNPTIIGEIPGGHTDRVAEISRRFSDAGLASGTSANIMSEEWSKFVSWLGLSALSVMTRAETYKFLSDPDSARIAVRIMRETAQLPHELGIPLNDGPPFSMDQIITGSEDDAVASLQARGQAQSKTAPSFRQSMLQDVDKGKRIEVEETFGDTIRQAKAHGIAMPTVETCYHILAGISRLSE
ncbi:MAG: 2-dehydropantoate 2-reductase, partial [Rhodospirillaceae bacterium]|nr:2-dehydropantoate 2-reductase [Rhodospirillaceae bacterium]